MFWKQEFVNNVFAKAKEFLRIDNAVQQIM